MLRDRQSSFTGTLWKWFARSRRSLPWRDLWSMEPDARAYRILVSEVMLQQTQVPRVVVIFTAFLRKFPTISSLAAASNRDVLIAWKGMGYNNRALRLRDAAKIILHKFHGTFPRDRETLLSIPGIGPYTAGALLNFAFNIPTPCVDTNILRILHRFFAAPEKSDGVWAKDIAWVEHRAHATLHIALEMDIAPQQSAAEWHAALMDFGSLVCTKRNPSCSTCPLKGTCKSAGKIVASTKRLKSKQEPGFLIDGVFVPRRIVRGRVVDLLRHAVSPLTRASIARHIDPLAKAPWIEEVLTKLLIDGLIRRSGTGYSLAN